MTDISIVTGGASGIGAAIGAALVRRSGHIVLADVDGGAAEQRAALLNATGAGTAEGVTLDVRDSGAVTELVQRTYQANGRLDYLFNNAGIGLGGEPEELLLDHWDRIIDVNLRGVIHGCHAAYPLMKQQGWGHIVNTASLAGITPCPGWLAPYSTTKFAVVGLSLALRSAGADLGIRVSAICPGFVDTPILDKREVEGLPTPPTAARVPPLREMLLTDRRFKLYPPASLAEDVMRGLAKNHALIVAPRSARVQWRIWRLTPSLSVRLSTSLTRSYRQMSREISEPSLPDTA